MDDFNLFDALFNTDRDELIAVLYEQRAISYGEMRAEVIRAAEVLSALGISTGERVGVLLPDSPEFIASFVAIISLGAIAVPINMGLSAKEQRIILKDCGARLAIVEGETCASLFENPTAADAPTIPESRQGDYSAPALKDLLIVRRGKDALSSVKGLKTQLWESAVRRPLTQNF